MVTEQIGISQVSVNENNPRFITEAKFQKLVDSLLSFPKMMEIRPIVVDDMYKALGGNMRLRALNAVAAMDGRELRERIAGIPDVNKLTEGERAALIDFWENWQSRPFVTVINANRLSEQERRKFIITDNASFGQWDYELLANEWDSEELNNWGVDVWSPDSNGGWNNGTQDAKEERLKKATELLSELKFDSIYYEPKRINGLTLEGCVDNEMFSKKIAVIENSGLSDERKKVMREFAYRFKRIDFEGVANYYSFFASPEEKSVMERLRLVLIDDGSVQGFLEDDLIRLYNKSYPDEIEQEDGNDG